VTHLSFVWRRLSTSRRATLGAILLGTLVLIGIFAEIVAAPAPIVGFGPRGLALFPAVVHAADHDGKTEAEMALRYEGTHGIWPLVRFGPTTVAEAGALAPPSIRHPLGTDAFARDLAARIIYGARTALGLALAAVLLSMVLGVALGGLAGYYRGFWNDRLVRLVETVDTFPAIIVVALVRAIERHPSALSLVVAVSFVRWAEVARLVRAEVLRVSAEDYVLAARALGCPPLATFGRHILPNAIGPVVVSSVFGVASVVLLEAAISFLAMGVPSPVASWGETLAEGAKHPSVARLIWVPGLALLATVGGSYLIADALRDALDPHTVRRRPEEILRTGRLSIVRDTTS
jgi:peptide/nickel transport system permease protein